jgi:hypothetical protein
MEVNMAEPKEKPASTLRTPKAKKKLGLSVPPSIRLPHDDLIFAESKPDSRMPRPKAYGDATPTPRTPRTPRTPPTSAIAPERDFARVANSIVREAVAGGFFTGKSKQLYDYLYSRTRGAIVPVRGVKVTKPVLMKGSHIGSERTLLKNLHHLKAIGLVEVSVTDGEHSGNLYTVMLPEEVPTPRTPRTPPTDVHHALPKVGYVPTAESGVGDVGSRPINSGTYIDLKTSFKTKEENLDDDAALAGLNEALKTANRELTGKDLSRIEADRWREVADVLVAELKIAAARTTVSSVPAFLAEHLRRRLWKIDKKQARAEGRELPDQAVVSSVPVEQAKDCPDCAGSGWWYPEGTEHGVAKCRHERLKEGSTE